MPVDAAKGMNALLDLLREKTDNGAWISVGTSIRAIIEEELKASRGTISSYCRRLGAMGVIYEERRNVGITTEYAMRLLIPDAHVERVIGRTRYVHYELRK